MRFAQLPWRSAGAHRHFGDADVAVGHRTETPGQVPVEFIGATQMTGHIRAHLNRDPGRRRQMEVREKIGDAVDMRQRNLRPARESLQLIGRQIAVLALNLPQVIEDQT